MRLVSVDLHTFGPDALTAVRLIEHQANAEQAAEARPQLVEQVPAATQGTSVLGEFSSFIVSELKKRTIHNSVG